MIPAVVAIVCLSLLLALALILGHRRAETRERDLVAEVRALAKKVDG